MKALKVGKGNTLLRSHMTCLTPGPLASDCSPRKSNGVKTRPDESHSGHWFAWWWLPPGCFAVNLPLLQCVYVFIFTTKRVTSFFFFFAINIQTCLWCTWQRWWWVGDAFVVGGDRFVGRRFAEHFDVAMISWSLDVLTVRLCLCLAVNPLRCGVVCCHRLYMRCIVCRPAHWTPEIHDPLCPASSCKHRFHFFFFSFVGLFPSQQQKNNKKSGTTLTLVFPPSWPESIFEVVYENQFVSSVSGLPGQPLQLPWNRSSPKDPGKKRMLLPHCSLPGRCLKDLKNPLTSSWSPVGMPVAKLKRNVLAVSFLRVMQTVSRKNSSPWWVDRR